MDRRERSASPVTGLLAALEGWQAQIWTALPAVVTDKAPDAPGALAFDAARRTVTVQTLIQVRVQKPDATYEWISIPPLLDVPVQFPGGGGCHLTFPLKAGDEGLVIISSRCIDAWWQNGWRGENDVPQPQVQMEFRLHDLSDGFFIPTVQSLPNVIEAISTTTAQFRSDTGETYVEVDPADGFVNIVTPGDVGITVGGDMTATVTGNMTATVTGNATATVTGNLDAQVTGNATLHAQGDVEMTSDGSTHITATGGCTVDADTEINGDVVINGNLTVNGVSTLNGPIAQTNPGTGAGSSFAGNMNVGGTVAATNVTGGGIDLKTHKHGGVQVGGGQTGVPV